MRKKSALTMSKNLVARSGYINHPSYRTGVDVDDEAFQQEPMGGTPGSISNKYLVPPFSILDTRQDNWRKRRRWWLGLGIKSEIGRGAVALPHGEMGGDGTDPVSSKLRAFSEGRQESKRANDKGYSLGLDKKQGAHPVTGLLGQSNLSIAQRREADQRSNLNNAASLPDYADFGTAGVVPGTSIFDPVLCEMMYKWFAPPGGRVIDPFAGGSVRGIVAAWMGHPYVGIDLSAEQIEANREQAREILTPRHPTPHWTVGDSREVLARLDGESFDLMLTCPPYYDLEVYSDDPRDISNMSYDDFLEAYRDIFREAARVLRPGRLGIVVTSEVRDRRGNYRGLVPDTIQALEDAGLAYYNEAILVNTAGTLPMRLENQFGKTRKLGRMHQNVIIAIKGDPERGWSVERDYDLDPQLHLFG